MGIELLTSEEIPQYLDRLYARLLEHRYRYYILAEPVLEDELYDWLERHYNALADQHGSREMDMVDWNIESPGAKEAAYRVDNKLDYYNLWLADMLPVWERLGFPRYKRNEESKKGSVG